MGDTTKTKTATQTQVTDPWEEQIPYLKEGFAAAEDLWKQPGPSYFPASTVAGFSPDQITAQNLIRQRALAGNPLLGQAQSYVSNILQGGAEANPWDDAVFNNIRSKVMPALNSSAMMSGRFGSMAADDTMARAMTEAYAPYASQNWQFGKNLMMDASKWAPDLAFKDYQDYGALDVIGGAQQSLAQKELQDAMSRWDYNQQLPYNKLSDFLGLIGGNFGGTSTTSSPYEVPNTWGTILGTGTSLLGSALGSVF